MTSNTGSSPGRATRAQRPFILGASRALAATLLAAATTLAFAIQPVTSPQRIAPQAAPHAQDLDVQPELEATIGLAPGASPHAGVGAFLTRNGGEWEMRWDRRADRPELIQGSGIALIPGAGNTLTAASLGLPGNEPADLAFVEMRLRDFIAANDDLLRSGSLEFRLDPESSAPYGDGSTHWFVEFAQYAHGVRVKDAHLFFRLSHGNIVQFGSHLVAPVEIDATPVSAAANAFDLAVREMAFPAGTTVKEILEPGELLFVPVAANGADAHDAYLGADGAGYAHRLVWRFVFRVAGDAATYEVLLDAKSNRLVDVRDLNDYTDATVSGGIYPTTNTDPEVVVPFPYTSVSNGGAKITDALGIYDYSGGSATVTLNGQYFRMSDTCGSISLANSTDGNLNLGSSSGTDCTTPGIGGAGNTHASRSGFYHLTKINEKARAILPTNTWLKSKVTANMNLNQVCNAYWDGSALNFFKSGSGCSNTGEIAAVFLHEWGHGLDTNTGGAANEYGSGEAVGDTFAFLETRDACIGKNFQPGVACHNCNSTCTGVRDISAFAIGGSHTIAKPANVISTTGIDCNAYRGLGNIACPYNRPDTGTAYRGPMGWEGHCESYIASTANWDLAQSLVSRYGVDAGYAEMDLIWYGSLTPSKSAYRVASGGTCNANASVDGCASSNWYTVFLAADDDDGDLSNGTPNACLIWDAMDAHGIACGTRPACSPLYTIGGSVNGLAASGLKLSLNNGAQTLDVPSGATSFTFPTSVRNKSNYSVQIDTQPSDQECSLTGNTGMVDGANVTSIAVSCSGAAATYTIGGSISGLTASGLKLSLNKGAQMLDVPAGATGFTFLTPVADHSAYDVEISTLPSGVNCSLSGNVGTVDGVNVTSIAVSCAAIPSYTIGGSVSGLTANGLKLSLNNGAQMLDLPAGATGFTFPTPVADHSAYDVEISTLPSGVNCSLSGNVGTVDGVNVTSIAVSCAAIPTYTIGGSVSGLTANGLKLSLNNGAQMLDVPAGATGFTFPTPVADHSAYDVEISTPPSGMNCSLSGNIGAVDGASVTSIAVSCAAIPSYTIGGSVHGLTANGLRLTLNHGDQMLDVASGATSFQFPAGLADGAHYEVRVNVQPDGLVCTVAGNRGTIAGADVADVVVDCLDRIFADDFDGG